MRPIGIARMERQVIDPRLSFYPLAYDDGNGGVMKNLITGEDATCTGGSTQDDPLMRFYDNYQRVGPDNPDLLGLRAAAATVNLDAGFPAGAQNTSAEIDDTPGDHTATNGVITVTDEDAQHGEHCFKLTVENSGDATFSTDITSVTANAQYTTQAMFKAPEGKIVSISLIGDVSGVTTATATATGLWQFLPVTKTFSGDGSRIRSIKLASAQAGNELLVDCLQTTQSALPLPPMMMESTAASGRIPTPVTAGGGFTLLAHIWRPEALLKDDAYEIVNCLANNAGLRLLQQNSLLSWERHNGEAGIAKSWDVQTGAGPTVIAASSTKDCVQRLAVNGASAAADFTPGGSGQDQFNYPYGVATDGTHIWVADTYNHRIVKRDAATLAYVSKIGSLGNGDDNFNNPRGITTDGTHIWVADTYNHRIVQRDKDLVYVSQTARAATPEKTLPANLTIPASQNGIISLYIWDGYAASEEELEYLSSQPLPPPRFRMVF